jgi:hypothetical protein
MAKLFSKTGADFDRAVDDVLDTGQWLRSFAYSCATGAGDSFFANSYHNGQFYARPDGKILYFTHDTDFSFSATRNIFQNAELQKLTADPARKRAYLAHLKEICSTVYNQAWMEPWATHFDALVPGADVFVDDLAYINSRSAYILGQVSTQVPQVAFAITTNGGSDLTTADNPVEISGNAWVDVKELRLQGSSTPIPLTWSAVDQWSLWLSISPGANALVLEAYDYAGNLVGTDTINVTSTTPVELPSPASLVISEIYYNPPGSEESTEYIELLNIHPTATLDLTGLSFTSGIGFTFPPGSDLSPGERVLLVKDEAAFGTAFGNSHPVAGTFSGKLDNSGEALALALLDGTPVQSFSYSDNNPWPTAADGYGYSLVLVDPFNAPDPKLAINWRASAVPGGSPGGTDVESFLAWKGTFGNPADGDDPDGDGWSVAEEYCLGGTPGSFDRLEPVFRFEIGAGLVFASVQRFAAADGIHVTLEASSDLTTWAPVEGASLLSNERTEGSTPAVDKLTFMAPLLPAPQFFRFVLGH